MFNHINYMLEQWLASPEDMDWVLATLVEIEGSSYRKLGAMMLINEMGQYHGLISGGCLEGDLVRQARKVLDDGAARNVTYDMKDEDSFAWQLGIGCGGKVTVRLQHIKSGNLRSALSQAYKALQNREPVQLLQSLRDDHISVSPLQDNASSGSELSSDDISGAHIVHRWQPVPEYVVFGAGTDAIPLTRLMTDMGWCVTIVEGRIGFSKQKYFPKKVTFINQPLVQLSASDLPSALSGVVIMNHNIELDALALSISASTNAPYVGLLGPVHRGKQVLEQAGLLSDEDLQQRLYSPIGIDLGGDLPEHIALSIVAQLQQLQMGASGNCLKALTC